MRDKVDCDIQVHLYATIEFIEQALKDSDGKAKILIHCYKVLFLFYLNIINKGNSRSAAILIGYYMWRNKWTTD